MKRLFVLMALVVLSVGCNRRGGVILDEQINVGTHSLHIYCVGEGSPVIVIDVGIGETGVRWQSVQDQLARDTRVCTYDRAGYGQSDPGPMPRHSEQMAGELKILLENSGVEGPYLLVGHSLGGLNMQIFASQYPEVVIGAVLLDPPPLRWLISGVDFPELYEMFNQQTEDLSRAAAAAIQSADPEEKSKASFYLTLASESEELLGESARQVAAIGSFVDMPLVVIGSGRPNPSFGDSAEAYQLFWIEQSRALADKSTAGHFILAEESGHHIHQDAPEMVMDAILSMLQQVR